ncbi:MAG: zinc ABC transporter substrate-binding protein [Bacilli bacterium]|nr:zinc ABC transporter substrate-binding protein [Bacilli bacterium]
MKKYVLLIGLLIISTFALTGCIKKDNMDDIKIITTTYPITNLAEEIYGNYSTVTSIYPNGVNINEYEITDKQIKEYAKSDLFIYNGLDVNEKRIATRLLNQNKKIKLIDATQGLTYSSSFEELWLSPANYLMMAQNIKVHLSDEIKSTVIKRDLDKRYENMKLKISKYDAQFKIIAENTDKKDVIIANNSLKFLSRYGFNIISIDPSEDRIRTNTTQAKENIKNNKNKTIFVIDSSNDKVNEITKSPTIVKSMTILSEDDIKNNETYETMMNKFIDNLRTEVYS